MRKAALWCGAFLASWLNVLADPPIGVLGVLSAERNVARRDACRATWFGSLDRYGIVGKFLLDTNSTAVAAEARTRGDVHVLGCRFGGGNFPSRFGEKFYLWFTHVAKVYPRATWVAKADDDVYACPSLFGWMATRVDRRVYLGWFHNGRGERVPHSRPHVKERMDEMWVVLGMDLATAIAARPYCETGWTDCPPGSLKDVDFGGVSLRVPTTGPFLSARGRRGRSAAFP